MLDVEIFWTDGLLTRGRNGEENNLLVILTYDK